MMRGGYSNSPLSPADASSTDVTGQGSNSTPLESLPFGSTTIGTGESAPLVGALNAAGGGRRRRRGRKMRGGTTMPISIGSNDVQFEAGNA
jgi:hypothetical protein